MRPAKVGGGGNVLNGEGPRESRSGKDLTVHDRVREVLVVAVLVHLDGQELGDRERSGSEQRAAVHEGHAFE